jgi:hypothetical protein
LDDGDTSRPTLRNDSYENRTVINGVELLLLCVHGTCIVRIDSSDYFVVDGIVIGAELDESLALWVLEQWRLAQLWIYGG